MLKIAKIANFKIERILERDFIPTNPLNYKVVIIQDFLNDLFLAMSNRTVVCIKVNGHFGQFVTSLSQALQFQSFDKQKLTNFSAEITKTASWADPEDRSSLTFNQIDGAVDRRSFEGHYRVDPSDRLPLNIKGRTGVIGRGLLGKWGPNHAADPIVTTWKRDEVRKYEFTII